jgi:hypothetical protein
MSKINQPRTDRSTDDDEPLQVPLEAIINDRGGDARFEIYKPDDYWRWRFRDERNCIRAKSVGDFDDLREAINHIRETQKRIGNLATPILHIV